MDNQNKDSEKQKTADHISSLSQEKATESNGIQIPQISLPKGGGALKGIDEKLLASASWVLPCCDAVMLTPDQTELVFNMTREISEVMREKYGFKKNEGAQESK